MASKNSPPINVNHGVNKFSIPAAPKPTHCLFVIGCKIKTTICFISGSRQTPANACRLSPPPVAINTRQSQLFSLATPSSALLIPAPTSCFENLRSRFICLLSKYTSRFRPRKYRLEPTWLCGCKPIHWRISLSQLTKEDLEKLRLLGYIESKGSNGKQRVT